MHAPSLVQGAFVLAAAATAVTARSLPGAALLKRHPVGQDGDCSPQPAGFGPKPSTDTPEAFQSYPAFASAANGASTPATYDLIAANQLATVQQDGGSYISYEEIQSYDVAYCAAQCDNRWPGCTSFNIYFERDPILDSAPSCPKPDSTTRIKCAYFSSCSTTGSLTNDGQYCYDFHVVMAGSNVYNKKGGCAPKTTTTPIPTTTPAATTTPKISTTPAAPSTTPKISTTPAAPTTTPRISTTPAVPTTTPKISTTPATTPSTTKAQPTTLVTTTKCTKPVTTPVTTKPVTTTTKPAPTTASTTKAAPTTTSAKGPGSSPPPFPGNNWGSWNHW